MSKFGWDLPPGVTTSMLPGNSPEEQAHEAKMDAIYDLFHKHIKGHDAQDDDDFTDLAEAIFRMCVDEYSNGYKAAQADEAYAKEMEQQRNDETL